MKLGKLGMHNKTGKTDFTTFSVCPTPGTRDHQGEGGGGCSCWLY
jgi:hypothetical protein